MLIYIIAWIWNNYVRVTHNLFLPLGVLLLLHENWCSLNNVGHMLRSGPSLFGTICLELIFLSNFILLTSRHNGVPVKIFEKLEKKTFDESDPKSELAKKVNLQDFKMKINIRAMSAAFLLVVVSRQTLGEQFLI